MLKRHSQIFLSFALLFDTIAVATAWAVAYVVRFGLGLFSYIGPTPPGFRDFAEILPIVIACYLVALGILGLYQPPQTRHLLKVWMQVAKASILGWAFMLTLLYFYSKNPYSRKLLAMCLVLVPIALIVSRVLLLKVLSGLRPLHLGVDRTAIIGTGQLGQSLLAGLRSSPWVPIEVAFFIGEDPSSPTEIEGVPVIGHIANLRECLIANPVENVFIAVPSEKSAELKEILSMLAKFPMRVTVLPDFEGVTTLNMGVGELAGIPAIQLRDTPIYGWRAVTKRTVDVAGSLILLGVFGIFMLILAALVKLTSRGPAIFQQERMSLGGKSFNILKFRSMTVDAEAQGPAMSGEQDARRTRVGALMRRIGLDELPQLFNVLRGDMSLVGPRPERPYFIKKFQEDFPAYMLRHNVKAGITGWAQVNGFRGNTSFEKRLQYDLYYINNWSLMLDGFIVILTPITMLFGRNERR